MCYILIVWIRYDTISSTAVRTSRTRALPCCARLRQAVTPPQFTDAGLQWLSVSDVGSVCIRHMRAGVVGPRAASFLGVVLPWLVTMFCYQGSMLVTICNWSALLTIGVVNLLVPIAVYREALMQSPEFRRQDLSESSPLLADQADYTNDGYGQRELVAGGESTFWSVDGVWAPSEPLPTALEVQSRHRSADEGKEEPLLQAVPDWLARYE